MGEEIVENVCVHGACRCLVDEGSAYCSLYCEEADEAETAGPPCECEHTECVGVPPAGAE